MDINISSWPLKDGPPFAHFAQTRLKEIRFSNTISFTPSSRSVTRSSTRTPEPLRRSLHQLVKVFCCTAIQERSARATGSVISGSESVMALATVNQKKWGDKLSRCWQCEIPACTYSGTPVVRANNNCWLAVRLQRLSRSSGAP